MIATHLFNKISFTLATFATASLFLCSCSDSQAEKDYVLEPLEPETAADSTADSTADTSSFSLDSIHSIKGFVNRGQMYVGNEIVLSELDSNLKETGNLFVGIITDSSGAYEINNVKLTQPYVHLEAKGKFNSVCFESDFNQNAFKGSVEAYADVRKGTAIDLNVLTHMQAKQLTFYRGKGISFDSAMAASQSAIADLLMLDTLDEVFNQMNLVTKQSGNNYLLGATVLAEGFLYNKDFDSVLVSGMLNDSIMGVSWSFANLISHDEECFKMKEYSTKYKYKAGTTSVKKYLDRIWKQKLQLGECSSKNYNEIKSVAYNAKVVYYCDSTRWKQGDCSIFDKITLNSSVGDTVAGHLTKGAYCSDKYYYWESSEWHVADNIERGLKFACVQETKGSYGKSGDKCYYCNGKAWGDADTTACKENWLISDSTKSMTPEKRKALLKKEESLLPCGEEESFRKGIIDSTINFYCYHGQMTYANDFDLAMGHGCNEENKGYFKYQNSMYNCNGYIWKYATDSLIIGTITDARDSAVYRTIGIGNQVWIAQNMNYAIDSSWCPEDSARYCEKYGRFYKWDEILGANAKKDVCPKGFHIPTNKEWDELVEFAQPWFAKKTAITIFASKDALEHSDGAERGDDLVGFSVFMLGSRSLKGSYTGWLRTALYCSQDHTDSTSYIYTPRRDDSMNFSAREQAQNLSCNVRCLKD